MNDWMGFRAYFAAGMIAREGSFEGGDGMRAEVGDGEYLAVGKLSV